MMDMKKGVVNETVKENRADELSAMFNMMMDNRKRIMGQWLDRFRWRHDRWPTDPVSFLQYSQPHTGCCAVYTHRPDDQKPSAGRGS